MQVVVDIPDWLAQQWREMGTNPSRALLETFAAEGYRAGRLTRGEVRQMLGMNFYEAEDWFYQKGLPRKYTIESYEQDLRTIAELFPNLK